MQKIGRFCLLVFLILTLLFQIPSQGQSKKYFVITGKIVPETESTSGNGIIEVTKNGKQTSTINIPKNGRFRFELEFFNEFSLIFKYPGHFNKIINVSTEIPQEVWQRDNDFPAFPMIVQLFKEFEGVDKSFALKPSGRIYYDKEIDNFAKESFTSDMQFSEQISTAKTKDSQVVKEAATITKENAQDLAAKQRNFDQLIKEADSHYQRGEYQMALMKYMEAHSLFPEKAYPNDRVAELQDLVKALEITEKQKADLEQKYKSAIAKANGFYDKKNYKEARPIYEEALQYKPGDVFSNGRINEIDQLLALLEKQNQFKDLIANADNNYKSKNLDQAIALYNQAKLLVPEDQYPQNQINLINQEKQQQAKLDQLDKEFNQYMQTANTLVQQKDYLQALNSYKKALGLKPDNKLVQDKIAETELAIVAVENDKKYLQAIQLADQALARNDIQNAKTQYLEALKIKSETYPKTKLAEIAAAESKENAFNILVAKAEKSFADNEFDEALNEFTEALKLKPSDASVKKRIEDIQNIKNKELSEKEYAGLIAQADQNFKTSQFDEAISAYNKALQIKKTETYPKDQLKRIDSYQSLIKKADKSFQSKDYPGALISFNSALELKANDGYATSKITEIQKILADQKQLEEKANTELLAYNETIKAADQLFIAQSYPESLSKYKEALVIKATETYPQKRIKEIETILDKAMQEKARIDKEYATTIAQADNLFEKKDYQNAQASYRKALTIKADQVYPKDQIRKIDETLAENRRREEENQKQQQDKQNLAFNQAMASADKSFSENDFNSAKTGYGTALSIKPNDPTAKEKYGQTEAKLAQIARNTQAYNTAITEANSRLTAKKYPEAREKYIEALQYLPDSDYPKRQVTKIDELLAQQEAEVKKKRDFDQALAEGESLFKNKDLQKAKDSFMKAYNLIPSEVIPPKRISEINDLIAEQERNETALKATKEAYQQVIGRADNLFGNKEYVTARLAYNEALLIKSDEKYPVSQLALIEKLLKEQNELNYKTAIAKADNSFNSNLLDNASLSYNEALQYKKDDKYATQRLKDIDQKKADLLAESDRLKKLEDQYKALITDANQDFNNKDFPVAKGKYQKALTIKPAEVYPKDQIAKIDELIDTLQKAEEKDKQYAQFIREGQEAFQANKLKEARVLYQKGYNLKPTEALPPMRIAEIDRLLAQQAETAQLAAMEEAQRLAKEKADRVQYNNDVTAGDKAFTGKLYKIAKVHYTNALTALPNEKYPKDQIAKIEDLIAQEAMDKMIAEQKAQQDSIKKNKDRLFDAAMSSAKDHDQNKRYEQAIQKYNDAISIKPEQQPVIQKYINDIQNKMQLLAQQEAEYKRLVKLADGFFTEFQLNEALVEYQNALKIKPDLEYPKNQVKEIQSQLAAREQNYASAIAKGNKAYDASDWVNAKTGYTEALSVKPNETYPADRLKDVNQKIADANLAAKSNSVANKAYNDAIESAEKAFKDNQLSSAKMQFQMAQSIKPEEKLPAQRIKEIDVLIDQRNKERLANAQREIDEKYGKAISVADNSYRNKSYSIAKLQYQQASLIKPDESYPKTQMALMDKLMNEAKPAETYVMKIPDIEPTTPVSKPIYNPQESAQATEARAQVYNTITDYDQAIKKADDLFGVKDYTVARFYYYKASEIKPSEEYPKNQVDLIRKLIDSQLSASDLSEYDKAIKQADDAFAIKNYQIAKFFYYKALDIKSWEKYPKDRINEILALTNSLLSEKEEKEYRDIIAKADEAYFNKDMAISRFYYNKAISMKKDENYPRIKLKDIQKLIEQDSRDRENEQYRNLVEQGDQALQTKNYSIARFNYNKALTMKPDEEYPKEQLKKLKDALDNKNN
jgi:tetratricopeptide (TPR) repeat protein